MKLKQMKNLITAILISIPAIVSGEDFYISNYGVAGDGVADDGPAIESAIDDMINQTGSHRLIFESSKSYYVKNIEGTYLFDIENKDGITIEGNGSEFLLDGAKRFINAFNSENIILKDLSIDYKPLPFVEGVVINKNQNEEYIDVKINDHFTLPPLGGPTNAQGEQAYFGMLWYQGPNSLLSTHYYVNNMTEAYPGSLNDRVLRVEAKNFSAWDKISVNSVSISLPVRGIAHMGGDHVVRFVECTNVKMENVNIWTAPWFAVGITRNSGNILIKNVNIKPPSGTPRILSSWRDGFHVKSNYASLLFEDCHLEGMGDDAFNTASFMSSVKTVLSTKKIQIKQNYPLDIVPYKPGDMVVVYDIVGGKILGRSKVSSSIGFVQSGEPVAPLITLYLEEEVPGMNGQCVVWNESSANPNTTLKNCKIFMSCRFQSSVTIDSCHIVALSWFYGAGANVEGPLPSNVIVKNSDLFLGRGNDLISVSFNTAMKYNGIFYEPKSQPIKNVLLQNNEIDGNLVLKHCENVSVVDNNFSIDNSQIQVKNCRNLLFRNNTQDYLKIQSVDQINFQESNSKNDSRVESSIGETTIDLMKPFPHWYAMDKTDKRLRFHALSDSLKPGYLKSKEIDNNYYECYKITLPNEDDQLNEIRLKELNYYGTNRMLFWTYIPDGEATIKIFNRMADGRNNELYSAGLAQGSMQDHDVSIGDSYPGEIEVVFYAKENAIERSEVFLGGLQFVTDGIGLSNQLNGNESKDPVSDPKKEINIIPGFSSNTVTISLPNNKGRLDVFDMNGRLLKSKNTHEDFIVLNTAKLEEQLLILKFTSDDMMVSRKFFLFN